MNAKQRTYLQADLWPRACQVQGWDVRDRAKRLEVCGEALGREIESTNEIDSHDEFTTVKNHLLRLADSIQGASEDGDLTESWARVRREKIRRQVRCIALYPLEAPRGTHGAESYVRTMIREMCGRAGYEPEQFEQASFNSLLEALQFPQLVRLVKTLDARLNAHNRERNIIGMRVRAGHTLHDMYTAAQVPCPCKKCRVAASGASPDALPQATPGEPELDTTGENQPF
jgi:hypothetical protein